MPPFLAWLVPFAVALACIVFGYGAALAVTGRKADIRDWIEWAVRVLGTLPSTNLKVVSAIVATHVLIVGTLAVLAIGRTVDEGALAILAGLAIGVDVVALKQFGKKRETDAAHVAAQAQARAAPLTDGAG